MDDMNYDHDAEVIKAAILSSQYRAGKAANGEQLALYYAVGGYVSANTRNGFWGTGALATISSRLQRDLPGLRGFSERNLKYMRTFYEEWSPFIAGESVNRLKDVANSNADSALASAELTTEPKSLIRHLQVPNYGRLSSDDFMSIGFTHHRTILEKVKELEERLFYIHRCAEQHFNVDSLKQAIRNDDYHHQGALPNNFLETIPSSQLALRAVGAFKDEYLLDFINVEELGVRDAVDIDERVVEQAIVHNVKNFIMTFGRDFTFVGNQYHLEPFGEDQWIDLLFFNRALNCLVAVELKRGKFKTAYLGQLSGYLSVLDEFERKPHENPAIGIVLCKDMNEAFVDLVVRDYTKPMGVATYKTAEDMPQDLRDALPDIAALKALLEREDE